MGLNDRIREARLMRHMTQEQLAEKIGVAKSTLTGYEKGNREPNIPTLMKIMDALHVDANYLYQDEMGALSELVVSMAERDLITKYRDLDETGRKHVDTVILWESERIQAAASVGSSRIAPLPTRIISYYQRLASAGTGEYLFSGIPTDTIEVPITPVSELADFVVGVNGDSMEPTYYDGDKVYVEELGPDELSVGEIGIFMIDNECYIKEVGDGKLISHNKKYRAIKDERNVRAIGRVLGKVEEN